MVERRDSRYSRKSTAPRGRRLSVVVAGVALVGALGVGTGMSLAVQGGGARNDKAASGPARGFIVDQDPSDNVPGY